MKDKKDSEDTKKTPPQPSPKGREEEKKVEDVNNFVITKEWLNTKHEKFSFDWMMKTIIALAKIDTKWECYVPDVNDVSEDTYNALEAFGFDIIYKTRVTNGLKGVYIIKWGE